jgi:hypothetical protein
LQDILAEQHPPTLTVHEKLQDWKSDHEHTKRVALRIDLPAAQFTSAPFKMIFTIVSHDQGWSNFPHDHGTYHGGSSAFHATIHHDNKQQTVATKLRPRIVQNVHAA